MSRLLISSGSAFEELAAYSRAVVDGRWVFVSGTTGFDYAEGTISEGVIEQTEQALRTIVRVLAEAGATMEDVVRVRVFISEPERFEDVARVLGRYFREIRPANTTVVTSLIDPRMKVEIEVTALKKEA